MKRNWINFNMSNIDWTLHTYHTLTFQVIWSNFTLKMNIFKWELIACVHIYLPNICEPIYVQDIMQDSPRVLPSKETPGS